MKVLIIPVPNLVPNDEILAAMQNFFNEIGVATKMTIVEEPDATPSITGVAKTPFMMAVDKCISQCGCGDNELSFKSKFRELVINHGDPNFELLELITARKNRKENQYLKDNHLEWLPAFADRMSKSIITLYGKDL